MKSDPSFTDTVVWNTLPVPAVREGVRHEVSSAGGGIFKAREAWPGPSLAELYDPDRMPSELRSAHDVLDRVVDRSFGAKDECLSERERQKLLFSRYAGPRLSDLYRLAQRRNRILPSGLPLR